MKKMILSALLSVVFLNFFVQTIVMAVGIEDAHKIITADFENQTIDSSLFRTFGAGLIEFVDGNNSSKNLRLMRSSGTGYYSMSTVNPIAFDSFFQMSLDMGSAAYSSSSAWSYGSGIGIRIPVALSTAYIASGNGTIWLYPLKDPTGTATSNANSVVFHIQGLTDVALCNLNTVLGGTLGTFSRTTTSTVITTIPRLNNIRIMDTGEWAKFYMVNDSGVEKCVASLHFTLNTNVYTVSGEYNSIDIYYGDGTSTNGSDYQFVQNIATAPTVATSTSAGIVRVAPKTSMYYTLSSYRCYGYFDNLNIDWDNFDLGNISNLTTDISLPTQGLNGATISWASSDESVISNTGVVTRPPFDINSLSKNVTLTATFSKDGKTIYTKAFIASVLNIDVPPDNAEIDVQYAALKFDIGNITNLTTDIALSTEGIKETTISWESSDDSIITNAGVVTRPPFEATSIYKNVTLTATFSKAGYSATKEFVASVLNIDIPTNDLNNPYAQIRLRNRGYLLCEGVDTTTQAYKDKTAIMDENMDNYLAQLQPSSTVNRTTVFLDYVELPGVCAYQTMYTFYRMVEMAKTVKTIGSRYYENTYVINELIEAMKYIWQDRYRADLFEYYYPNGRYHVPDGTKTGWAIVEFHIPKCINDLCTILYDEVNKSENKAMFLGLMDAIDMFTPNYNMSTGGGSGSNGTAVAWAVAMRSVLLDNPEPKKFDPAINYFDSLINYTNDKNGFNQYDDSSIYHAGTPYLFLYNRDLFSDGIKLSTILHGTEKDVFSPKKDMYLRWIYYSYSPNIYKSNATLMNMGRDTGNGEVSSTVKWLDICAYTYDLLEGSEKKDLGVLIKYYANQIIKYYGREPFSPLSIKGYDIVNKILADDTIGTDYVQDYSKVYPRAARVMHLRPNYGVGLAMFAKDVPSTEMVPENKRGWHYGSGMLYVYTDDINQYGDNYVAVVDSQRIPGTTVENGSTPGKMLNVSNVANGALLDNRYTSIAFEYNKPLVSGDADTVSANKSYFMFDKEIVCIGSEINSTSKTRNVETTFENRALANDNSSVVTIDDTVKENEFTQNGNVGWAHIAGLANGAQMGYYFPGGQYLNIVREKRIDKWSNVQSGASADDITKYFLTMYKNHGIPSTDGSYKYVILPTMSVEDTKAYNTNPKIEIINDDNGIHAVRQTELNITVANFYNQTGGSTANGFITSDKPASVMVREDSNAYYISIADTTRENAGEIKITLPITGIVGICNINGIRLFKNQDNIELYADVSDKIGLSKTVTIAKNKQGLVTKGIVYRFDSANNAVIEKGSNNVMLSVEAMPATTNNALKIQTFDAVADITDFENNSLNGFTVYKTNGTIVSNPPIGRSGSAYKTAITTTASKPSALQKAVNNPNYIEAYVYDPGPGTKTNAIVAIQDGIKTTFLGIAGNSGITANYAIRTGSAFVDTQISRKTGWVKISFERQPLSTRPIMKIDDIVVNSAALDSDFPVNISNIILGDIWGNGVEVESYFDDIKMQYASEIDTSLVYKAPFQADGVITYKADIYTDYAGDTAIYPFVVTDSLDNPVLNVGFSNGNMFVNSSANIVSQGAIGKINHLKTVVNTIDNTVKFYLNELEVYTGNVTMTWSGDLKTQISVDDAVVYMDNVSIATGDSPILTVQNYRGEVVNGIDKENGTLDIWVNAAYRENATIYFATYKNNKLINITKQPITNDVNMRNSTNKLIGENYTVKAFVWQNDNLMPLADGTGIVE